MSRKKVPSSGIRASSMNTPTPAVVSRPKPLVFISHDSRDAELALAFGNLLTDASGGILKSFRSSDKGTSGIEFGAEWYNTIMGKIRDATDVVALLTQSSVDRPWILYEAGVAKGRLDSTVFGVAIGIPLEKASTGPFAQFQNSSADEDSLTKLVLQLIQRNPEASPREEAVRRQVKAFLDNLSTLQKTSAKPHSAAASRVDETAIAKLFEEVKVMFRELPDKVETKLDQKMDGRPESVRMDPRLAEMLLFRIGGSPQAQAAGWLAFLSAFRESLPWLYEPGLDLYRALRSKNQVRVNTAVRELTQTLEFLRRSEVLYMLPNRNSDREFFNRLPEMLEHYLRRLYVERPRRKRESEVGEDPS
jgi:hypothetical protein